MILKKKPTIEGNKIANVGFILPSPPFVGGFFY
jgi:hypothetical protein